MRCIATEFNLTIFKSSTLKRTNFAWKNFESLKYKISTPFNSPTFVSATLHLFKVSRNISGITPYC